MKLQIWLKDEKSIPKEKKFLLKRLEKQLEKYQDNERRKSWNNLGFWNIDTEWYDFMTEFSPALDIPDDIIVKAVLKESLSPRVLADGFYRHGEAQLTVKTGGPWNHIEAAGPNIKSVLEIYRLAINKRLSPAEDCQA